MRIGQLWRYPVKSFGGERMDAATVESDGLRGDHVWAVVDPETGDVASAKRFRRWGSLLSCRARLLDEVDPRDPAALEITLPDGTVVHGNDPAVEDLLSDTTGRPVRLETRPRTYDEAPLHLVSTSAVDALGTGDASEIALRRFRPQIVVAADEDAGFLEDGWVGKQVGIGSATVEPNKLTSRCVMVTLAHQEVPARRDMLRTVMARPVAPGLTDDKPGAYVGVYATVTRCGLIAVGDTLEIR
ncbi:MULTISPECIES: MOSC domain-containing protein [unclassified Rhodococcus (in: high G+C Gram-positive bacteria)]|uniref:MOSC domain-containing protein n=1 Tax=unclassified Rhodococcus (in: high G+C Gram-positive bacteria) TaxID=192944 RepID=UPI00146BAFB1|nr:MOSC N-terminal beta barrel domain-containing protein [Rhodococcus sp. (in: high G+C Gram-positive bacteria)]MBF0660189.1 MOSC domain-containing protein [Rhodococcus sp. (in: high G+C Gram-positive bacteria)]NMD97565.1 MOSC domain-containing protein [Rhodococcus sp. BL-253-APC-6A1W]